MQEHLHARTYTHCWLSDHNAAAVIITSAVAHVTELNAE
jgi:hypothetical protein